MERQPNCTTPPKCGSLITHSRANSIARLLISFNVVRSYCTSSFAKSIDTTHLFRFTPSRAVQYLGNLISGCRELKRLNVRGMVGSRPRAIWLLMISRQSRKTSGSKEAPGSQQLGSEPRGIAGRSDILIVMGMMRDDIRRVDKAKIGCLVIV